MEALILAANENNFIQQLQIFNQENKNSITLSLTYGIEIKKRFVTLLVSKLQTEKFEQEIFECLFALRLCCREQQGLEDVMNLEFIKRILYFAGLIEELKEGNGLIIEEASKCLVNILMRDNQLLTTLILDYDLPKKIINALNNDKLPKSIRFAFGRLIFLITTSEIGTLALESSNVLVTLIKICEEGVQNLKEQSQYVVEALKCIFKISMPLGPLHDKNEEIGKGRPPTPIEAEAFNKISIILQQILFLPREQQYHSLKDACVNCLINVPACCIPVFDPERTLISLIDFLEVQVQVKENPAQALTPVLLVLTSIARQRFDARLILKSRVFPNAAIALEQPNDGVHAPEIISKDNSIGSRLLQHMTSFNIALKHYSCEFIYIIFDECVEDMVKITGFGNAAGFMANRNLFGVLGQLASGQATSVKSTPQRIPTQEELQSEVESAQISHTDSQTAGKAMGFKEFQDEAEAEKLAELIDNLEKKGMIKIIRKDDEKQQ
eukprot:TRINITY_DN8050_c0_g1_i1.p1 TRINITY_DN8050_c0_g1~~TRINITY_DN8050_c0_g1_i1.p1  ORF type:complete len:506 (-),score=247.62 TRINITY_DN8050_c0_g1_i1:66-1553(-)